MDLLVGDKCEGFPDLLRDQVGLAVILQDLDQPLGMCHCVCPTDNAVIGEENRVVVLDEGKHCLGEGLCSRRLVRATAERPIKISYSGINPIGGVVPVMANAVACGG